MQRSDDDAGSNARLYKEGTGGRRGRAEVRTQGQEYHKLRALTHTHTSRQAQKNAKLSGLEAAHTHMPSSIKQPMRARLSLLLGWQIDAPLRSPILTKLSYEVSLKKNTYVQRLGPSFAIETESETSDKVVCTSGRQGSKPCPSQEISWYSKKEEDQNRIGKINHTKV